MIQVNNILPFANIVIQPGSTEPNTAPLKLTTQPSPLTTPEQGTFELVGNSLQFSQLAKRRGVAMSQGVILADFSLSNSITESSAVLTAEHGANYLEIGKCEEIVLRGVIQQTNTGSGQMQFRIKYADVTLQTIQTVTGNIAANTPFELRVSATCRSIGESGTMSFHSVLWIDGQSNIPDSIVLATINTTSAQNTTITAKWTVANASNSLIINQGRILCIEPNR